MQSTSAITGEGIEQLATAIIDRLAGKPPANGEAMPFTGRQAELLLRAAAAMQRTQPEVAIAALAAILE
jgi:hypothetical protein